MNFNQIDTTQLVDYIINQTLPKVMGTRYLPVKYLVHDALNQIDCQLSTNQKRVLISTLLDILSSYLEQFDYHLVKSLKRFNSLRDIDSMIELYNIDNLSSLSNGSYYFEKSKNFITRFDVDNKLNTVASSYYHYLHNN